MFTSNRLTWVFQKSLLGAALLLSVSVASFAADSTEGTQTQLTPEQVQTLQTWTETSKSQLNDALSVANKALTPQSARDSLVQTFQAVITSGTNNPKETFLRYSINRALKLSNLVGSADQNSFIADLQKRLLLVTAESAIKLADSDFAQSAEYGISNTEFILSWSDSILNSAIQYQVEVMALGFLENDLYRDQDKLLLAPEISEIDGFLKTPQKNSKDSDYVKNMPSVRAVFARVLTDLKALPRFNDLIDDPTNPGLDYFRKALRNNLNDSDLDTRLRAMKSLATLELKEPDEIRLAQMLGDSSYTICSGAREVLRFTKQISPGVAQALYAASGQQIKECKDAAIILLGRVRTPESNGYLNNLYHSSCVGSDAAFLVEYSLALSSSGPTDDLLSVSESLCAGTACVGDWVAVLDGHNIIQGPVVGAQSGAVMVGSNPTWIPIKNVGHRVPCSGGVCREDVGMIQESTKHKVGAAIGRGLLGMATGGFFPLNPNAEAETYDTFYEVAAVFDNGLIQIQEVNGGLRSGWTTTAQFTKSLGETPPPETCYVPVQDQ